MLLLCILLVKASHKARLDFPRVEEWTLPHFKEAWEQRQEELLQPSLQSFSHTDPRQVARPL